MFTAAITPAFRAAGTTIARVAPDVLRFAGTASLLTVSSYCSYVVNKEIIDPFVTRQTAKFAHWSDRRAVRIAARRKARYALMTDAELAAEVEHPRMANVPAATRRRAAQPQTVEGEVYKTAPSAVSASTVETAGARA